MSAPVDEAADEGALSSAPLPPSHEHDPTGNGVDVASNDGASSVEPEEAVHDYDEEGDDCALEDPEAVAEGQYLALGHVRHLQWRLVEEEVEVVLDPLGIHSRESNPVLFQALGRDSDAAYRKACGQEYVVPIPPLQIRGNAYSFKTAYLNAIRLRLTCAARIGAIDEELVSVRSRVRVLKSLVAACEEKIEMGALRCSMYEEEMGRLPVKGAATAPHRFCAFLMNTNGYSCVSKCLLKEARRLRTPKDQVASVNRENVERDWEESNGIDRETSMREVLASWDMLQVWQLLHGVYVMARNGKKGYPVTLASSGGQRASADESDGNYMDEFDQDGDIAAAKGSSGVVGAASGLNGVFRDVSAAAADVFTAPLLPAVPGNGIAPWERVCGAIGVSDAGTSSHINELVEARRRQASEYEGGGSNSRGSSANGARTEDQTIAGRSDPNNSSNYEDKLTWLHKAIIVACHFLDSRMSHVVSSLARNSLNHAVNEMFIHLAASAEATASTGGTTHEMQKIADALLYALSDIGESLERTLLLRFRTLPQLWIQSLSNMRKLRVRQEGGKIVNRDNGEVEIATNGAIRKIPLVDDFVNTDVIHGSMQRAKAQIVVLRARELLQEAKTARDALRGERSCMCLLRFVLPVPLIQRNIRGYLVRRKYVERRRMMLHFSMHAAACTIQAWSRGIAARRHIEEERARRRNAAALRVQALVRGFIARCLYYRARRAEAAKEKERAVVMMQALARGFLIRCRIFHAINAGAAAAKEEEKGWAAVVIQRIARGYIARKTVVKSYHIRNTLSKPVLRLAEQYLVKGDLWRFLSELDGTYKRLHNELEDQKKREDQYADTFVKRVINQRKSDFDEVWNQFHSALSVSRAASSRPKADSASRTQRSNTAASMNEMALSAAGAGINEPVLQQMISGAGEGESVGALKRVSTTRSQKSRGRVTFSARPEHIGSSITGGSLFSGSSNIGEATGGSSQQLRPALSTGSLAPIPQGVASAKAVNVPGVLLRRAVASSVSAGVKQEMGKLLKSKSRMYKQIDTIKGVYESEEKNLKQLRGSLVRSSGELRPLKTRQRHGKSAQLSTPRTTTAGATESKGNVEAFHADWLSASIRDAAPEENASQGKDTNAVAAPEKGDSLLIDIPRGIEDKIERLLFAAALRCYVPDFFPHHSAEEAYEVYRRLPHGLAKVRYEHATRQWSQQVVNRLKMKNLNYIKDLLPISKGTIFLHNVECPSSLVTTAVDMVQQLQKLDTAASGYVLKDTKEKIEDLLAKGSVKVLAENDVYSDIELGDATANAPRTSSADPSATIEEAAPPRTSKSRVGTGSASTSQAAEPASLAERMLSDIVGSGSWARMEAPVDDLLLHAAFLVCGNVPAVTEALSTSTLVSKTRHKSHLILQLRDGYRGFTRLGLNRVDEGGALDDKDAEFKDVFGNPKNITLHGHDSFVDFGYYLEHLQISGTQRGDSNDAIASSLRNAIRDRYKTALLMATPFELHLKASGVTNVAQLIRYDLGMLELPVLYRVQVESMLSTVVAKSMDAKELPNLSAAPEGEMSHHMTNQIAFKVPLAYDSRFQRGPFDPYGKPPRLQSQANTSLSSTSTVTHRSKPSQLAERSRTPKQVLLESEDNDSDLPKGLWDTDADGAKHAAGGEANEGLHAKEPLPAIIRERRDLNERKGTYDRPYVCSKPGCLHAFSRLYALRMHERTHATAFGAYEGYRSAPQYMLDPTAEEQAEADARREARAAALPDFVLGQLGAVQS